MGFQVSPGVDVREIDLTNVIPAVSTTVGGIAGRFAWGPIDEINLVTDEEGLVDLHGKPDNNNYRTWFTAANFLSYGNALRTVRVAKASDTKNAAFALTGAAAATGSVAAPGGVSIALQTNSLGELGVAEAPYLTNEQDIDDKRDTIAPVAFAKYAGALGNSIQFVIYNATGAHEADAFIDLDGTDPGSTQGKLQDFFSSKPNDDTYGVGGSDYAIQRGGSNDEVNVLVLDRDGKFTGVPGTVLESFELLSLVKGATKSDGSSAYVVDVLNSSSKYLGLSAGAFKWNGTTVDSAAASTAWSNAYYYATLTGGNDGGDPAAGDYYTAGEGKGYALLEDSETVDVSLLLYGGADDESASSLSAKSDPATVAQNLVEICETRKDCVAFVSPNFWTVDPSATTSEATKAANIIDWRKTAFNKSSSYAVVDTGWKYQYDPYNDLFRYIPLNGDVAGLCVRTDEATDPWFSPAGFNRGQINRVAKLAHNPRQAHRDDLYLAGVNPVVSFPGQGTILFGDKTALAKPSAFDRINVRRLFIVLEKAIATAAKFQLFELNDEFTRAQFVSIVNPFLRDVKGRRGIYDFLVVCDETNNTPEVIDGNRFVADIFIKPARSINFMQLNFIATRTGVAFSEVAGV